MKKITKKQLRDFARIVKNGNVGNYYTLYTDGSYNESIDPYTIVVGKEEYVSRQCRKGDTIEFILQEFDVARKEREQESLYAAERKKENEQIKAEEMAFYESLK